MFLCVKAENLGYDRCRCFSILQVRKCLYNVTIAYLETVKFTGKESARLMLRSLLLLIFNPLPPPPLLYKIFCESCTLCGPKCVVVFT